MVQKICSDEGKLCSVQLSTSSPLTNAISQITFSCIALLVAARRHAFCFWHCICNVDDFCLHGYHIGPLVRAPIQYHHPQVGRLGYTSNLFAYEVREGGQIHLRMV